MQTIFVNFMIVTQRVTIIIVLLLFEYFCFTPFVLLRKTTKQQTTTIMIALCAIIISLHPFSTFLSEIMIKICL